jgi:glycosyltransferase involved in cell wall biosynthesis
VATGKLFEYLGAGRPVLVLGADSEAARIVVAAGAGTAAPGDDAGAIASALEGLADHGLATAAGALDTYSWPVLAERWEQEIEAAAGGL